MWVLATHCDEFYVATRLYLKLELSPSRESLLHFCELLRRAFPGMTRFRRRSDGVFFLDEEERAQGSRRYLRLDADAVRFGHFNPPNRAAVTAFARVFFAYAPHHLSLSDLDYDTLEVVYGFDLEYSGNHDELVAETLLGENPLQAALAGDGHRVIDCQPSVGVALSDDYSIQAYVDVRGRTAMYELRRGEYEARLLSVYLTIRRDLRTGSGGKDLAEIHAGLLATGEEIASSRVVPQIVRPLREAIASRR